MKTITLCQARRLEVATWKTRTGPIGLKQAIEGDRKVPYTGSRRVPDRIGDGARRAGDADFADALDAERIHVRVVFLDQDRLERRHVGIDRDMVLGEVRRS